MYGRVTRLVLIWAMPLAIFLSFLFTYMMYDSNSQNEGHIGDTDRIDFVYGLEFFLSTFTMTYLIQCALLLPVSIGVVFYRKYRHR
jgi:uncharacterized membrane protein